MMTNMAGEPGIGDGSGPAGRGQHPRGPGQGAAGGAQPTLGGPQGTQARIFPPEIGGFST